MATGTNHRRKRIRQNILLLGQQAIQELLDNDTLDYSDPEDEENEESSHGPRQPNKKRGQLAFHNQLIKDYFSADSTYNDKDFKQQFRLDKPIFLRVVKDLTAYYPYFVQKPDCTGKLRLSPEQKITAVLQQSGYGIALNATDEYCRLGETTARQNMEVFCGSIQELANSRQGQLETNIET